MSLINDALKRARQAPPGGVQNPLPPLPPVTGQSASAGRWLMPAIVIFLVVAAIFSLGWAMAHRFVRNGMAAPPVTVVAAAQPPAVLTQPVGTPTVVARRVITQPTVVNEPKPPPLNPPGAPRLQGIFYSPVAPAAILDGNMVRPGENFLQYRVTEITRSTVTLAGPGGQAIKLGLGN